MNKMSWIIIATLIILAFIFLRIGHMKHRFFLIFIIVLLLFFYLTASRIFKEYDINYKSAAGMEKGAKIYFSWFGGLFGNIKAVTTDAIKMDWGQKNRTDTAVKIIEK